MGSGATSSQKTGTAKHTKVYYHDGEGTSGLTDAAFKSYIDYSPRGGVLNVWLTKKPYVGQNASIYVMLLDAYGEMSGAPIEVSLSNDDSKDTRSYLAKWKPDDYFVAFTKGGKPIGNPEILIKAGSDNNPAVKQDSGTDVAYTASDFGGALEDRTAFDVVSSNGHTGMYFGYFTYEEAWPDPAQIGAQDSLNQNHYNPKMDAAAFDDAVGYYVDLKSAGENWLASWGPIEFYIRQITAQSYTDGFKTHNNLVSCATKEGSTITSGLVTVASSSSDRIASGGIAADARNGYAYLLAPSGGSAQPKGFRENGQFVYKVNVPSILYNDMVLADYYVEYKHNATQISILPDKFGPYMYVEGESLVRRASDGLDLPVSFVIPKFKITTALTFTLQSTGDASTFTFQGDAYSDYSKFDMSRKVLADIQILDADDNYDGTAAESAGDPTDYRRYRYNDDTEGEYLWKDPSIEQHSNLDYSDPNYMPDHGGPITRTTESASEDTAAAYDTPEIEGGIYGGQYDAITQQSSGSEPPGEGTGTGTGQ